MSLLSRLKSALPAIWRPSALTAVAVEGGGGWFPIVREAWSGAWQGGVVVDAPKNVLAFSAVYSCVTIIASDIAKLDIELVQEDENGIYTEVTDKSPFLAVLDKPNPYQTMLKFVENWIVSKLLTGNTYVLKVRDQRGIVTEMYVLDARRVRPLITETGEVYYRIDRDDLNGIEEATVLPASEIIHDRMVCLFHPLVGISPIFACGVSATMGNKIQNNSTTFFENMSRPGGQLTAPGTISDELAGRLKSKFEENFSGKNVGRIFVGGDGLKYEAMPGIPANDAQLIEQLKWTVEDVARAFHVPLFKLGGPEPARTSLESMNQTYYSDCLQSLIESMESCLDDGLDLPSGYCTEFCLEGLIRMDTAARYEVKSKAVQGGWMAPDEARAGENLPPVEGGATPYLQQQNYSLAALAKRDALPDPFGTKSEPAAAAPTPPVSAREDITVYLLGEIERLKVAQAEIEEREVARIAAVPAEPEGPEPYEFLLQVTARLTAENAATIGAT